MSPLTLWSDAARTRFFLIPDEQQLSPGDFRIHTITGRKLTVDAAAIASFEITEEEAKKWLESQLGSFLDSARGAVERFIDRLTGADKDPLAPVRAAIETLEKAVNHYVSLHQSDTPKDVQALEQCAERLSQIVDRIRSRNDT